MPLQIIVMTSDKSQDAMLPGFAHLFNKYWYKYQPVTVCGFTKPNLTLPKNFAYVSLGNFSDYPAQRWSNALLQVLDRVAEEHFILMLDDYWLFRHVDIPGVGILYDYMRQFRYVLKTDLCLDRMGADWGRYIQGFNTYGVAGHLDLIHSPAGSNYQMSLWGGMWNRDLMRQFIVPYETAQQIELNGTHRVNAAGNNVVVLGTRQAPVIHGNMLQSGRPGEIVKEIGGWRLQPHDEEELKSRGML